MISTISSKMIALVTFFGNHIESLYDRGRLSVPETQADLQQNLPHANRTTNLHGGRHPCKQTGMNQKEMNS